MEKLFHAADQSATPDNLSQIIDEAFESLTWEDVGAEAFTGFHINYVEISPGPDGIITLIGSYPLINENALFVLSIFFSDGEYDIPPAGLHVQRAAV